MDKPEKPKVVVTFAEPGAHLPGTEQYAITMIDDINHGPIEFSQLGVSFDAGGGLSGFVPWAKVSGVVGWKPKPYADTKKGGQE